MKNKYAPSMWICLALSAVLLSIPWLVPHTGWVALFALVPLLLAEEIATRTAQRHFWLWYYLAFVLWNTFTTFWVCNATVGGGIFAILANAAQMALVFGLFRVARRRIGGAVPYIFLAALWIAWERLYFDAQISWPWLTLGNAFAGTTRLVQWYEYTGTLGGSLWIWAVNLGIFGIIMAVGDGKWPFWTKAARICSVAAMLLVLAGPMLASGIIYNKVQAPSEGSVDVMIGQPNFDPYHKFERLSQAEQNDVLIGLFEKELAGGDCPDSMLLMAPETFTSDIVLNDIEASATVARFRNFLAAHPGCSLLAGASTYEISATRSAPSVLARKWGDGWLESYNSAVLLRHGKTAELYHKAKLVVGVELTPYPKFFVPLDNWLSGLMGESGGFMGRVKGYGNPASAMHLDDSLALGCAICYESVYGEFATGYVKDGARMMTVITNDAWWGNTPGYRQHFNYSRLRAIELRRELARCANTGISGIIDSRGDVVVAGPWWEACVLRGKVNLSSAETFFVRNGDIVGRVSELISLLVLALLLVRLIVPKK